MKKKQIISTLGLAALLCCQPAMAAKCYWGYCNSKVAAEFGSKTSAKAAIYIPAEIAQLYKGCTISTVKVGLAAKSNVTVFITKDLNGDAVEKKTAGSLYKGWNDVKLSNAYTIDGDGFYIGYSYDGDDNSLGVSSMYSENGCWADLGDGWKNYATEKGVYANAVAIQGLINGDNLPKDYWIYANSSFQVKRGDDFTLNFGIKNMSPYIGRQFKVGYSIDGSEETVSDFSTTLGANNEKEFSIDLGKFNENGSHEVKLHLISVDGEQDAYAGNDETTLKLNVVNSVPIQRMVVEEGTGTWCQYCPKGIVAFDKMYEKYPDSFIGISVHKSDGSLTTTTYDNMKFSGYPRCFINRDLSYEPEPSFETFESLHNKTIGQAPVMDVDVQADFIDDSKTQISAKASTTFLAEHSGMKYRIAFVLTEDHIKGYTQANRFSGGSTPMGGFENMDYYASVDMDHVARMNYGYDGIEGSIPSSVSEGETTTYDAVLDIPDGSESGNPAVQSKDNLNIIALVINGSNGTIENAAEVRVGKKTTAIVDTQAKVAPDFSIDGDRINTKGFDGPVHVYNADGIEVANANLTPGLYIVKANFGGNSFVKKLIKR